MDYQKPFLSNANVKTSFFPITIGFLVKNKYGPHFEIIKNNLRLFGTTFLGFKRLNDREITDLRSENSRSLVDFWQFKFLNSEK